jgi:hypothetical protein
LTSSLSPLIFTVFPLPPPITRPTKYIVLESIKPHDESVLFSSLDISLPENTKIISDYVFRAGAIFS